MLISDHTKATLSNIIAIRIIVLTLGETQHFGWWKSQFLSQTGLSFLDRIFPRTKFAAAVRSASQVAKLSHDTSIGRGEVIHLFRIPSMEEAIDEVLSKDCTKLSQYFQAKLNHREELLQLLSSNTNGVTGAKQAGPIRLTKAEWEDLRLLAAIYFQGFTNKTPVYPYSLD